MINLEDKIGLKVLLKEDDSLEFDEDIEVEKVSERKFSDLAPVVADEKLSLSDDAAYTMYRNVRLREDESIIQGNNLRFDLTVIPSAMLGDEFVKTSGHYHPIKPGTNVPYLELYYVVSGQATYLMQKKEETSNISDVIICRVKAGEAIVMPPGYGHVTVNELNETLVMANWVSDSFQSIYDDYETLRGASYYVLKQGDGSQLEANKRYSAPSCNEVSSRPVLLDEFKDVPVYGYLRNARRLEFLDKPELFADELKKEALFQ